MFLDDLIIAIPTPYENGEVDLISLGRLAQYHVDCGYTRILICGSTGDQHMLSEEEKQAIVMYMHTTYPSIPVMYGVSGNHTKSAKRLSRFIQNISPSIPLMLSVPPYVLPTQDEVMDYVGTVLDGVSNTVLFYNNERRTGINVSAYTINCLMQKYPVIKAVKEVGSNQNIDFVTPYVYTGFDIRMIEPHFYNVTTVMGNIMPYTARYFMLKKQSHIHAEIQEGYREVIELLMPLGLVKVSKYLYRKQNRITSDETRLPLQPLTDEKKREVDLIQAKMTLLEQKVKEVL